MYSAILKQNIALSMLILELSVLVCLVILVKWSYITSLLMIQWRFVNAFLTIVVEMQYLCFCGGNDYQWYNLTALCLDTKCIFNRIWFVD